MKKSFLLIWFSWTIAIFAGTFYVDAVKGNDNNDGLTADSAWKSIAKVNSVIFSPGDYILFARGSQWSEQLNLIYDGISVASFGTGMRPIISGSIDINNFVKISDNIWSASLSTAPKQIFIGDIRGNLKDTLTSLSQNNDWYYSSSERKLYVFNSGPSISVEVPSRTNAIYISGNNINVRDFIIERTIKSGIRVTPDAENVLVDNIQFYQWSVDFDGENSAVYVEGKNTEISNCTFGKNTGNEIADQNWAGFEAVKVQDGINVNIHDNNIYHNSTENENSNGVFANGIYIRSFSGIIKIYKNYLYHTGSHAIRVSGYSNAGDSVFIYENTVEYPGQAGINAYKTRANDGLGGTGYIYKNNISFANRLGGDVGGGGSQSCGIHLNDGVIADVEPGKPFIKWLVFQNIVHDGQAQAAPESEDSGGIIADFNAHNAEIYRNLVYNNWGKGISIWNANNCKVYYNIVFGNDAGLVISAANGTVETANNQEVYNNTFFKNYNGSDKGSNLNTELFFGKNGHNSLITDNIFYASDSGFAYFFDTTNTSGINLNNNIIYKDNSTPLCYDNKYQKQNFEQWLTHHPQWDQSSINASPSIIISANQLKINSGSPAIDRGSNLGQVSDFNNNPIIGKPDIGALEYRNTSGVPPVKVPLKFTLFQNYPNPFNPSTDIKFLINADNIVHTTLKVYNILGKLIATLIDEDLPSGEHHVKFNAGDYGELASGVYFYTLNAGNFTETKKLILIR